MNNPAIGNNPLMGENRLIGSKKINNRLKPVISETINALNRFFFVGAVANLRQR